MAEDTLQQFEYARMLSEQRRAQPSASKEAASLLTAKLRNQLKKRIYLWLAGLLIPALPWIGLVLLALLIVVLIFSNADAVAQNLKGICMLTLKC